MTPPQHLPAALDMLSAHVIDNHTYLGSTTEYSGLGVADPLIAAGMVGAAGVVDVGCGLPFSCAVAQLVATDSRVQAVVAIHPNDAARLFQRDGPTAPGAELVELPALAALPGVVVVGEAGLDYYRIRDAEAQQVQVHSFRFYITLAQENNPTLAIYNRDAHMNVLKVLDSAESPKRVAMRCSSGDVDFARERADRGFWLSYPGVVIFGSAGSLREAARVTPLECILVETGASYLTPKPQRGKPNVPYLLPHTVTFLADLFDIDLADFCRRVMANTEATYTTRWGGDA